MPTPPSSAAKRRPGPRLPCGTPHVEEPVWSPMADVERAIPGGEAALRRWLRQWADHRATQRRYAQAVYAFAAFLLAPPGPAGPLPASSAALRLYLDGERRRGAAPATLWWKHSVLARFLRYCAVFGLVDWRSEIGDR